MAVNNSSRHVNIPIFIPHLGCPHQCVFCDQHTISGQKKPVTTESVGKTIEEWLTTVKPGDDVEIAFFGGSFTGIPRDLMTDYLRTAYAYVETGRVSAIRLSTRPDTIDGDTLNLLKRYGVGLIELGAQSLDDRVLELSGRGHTAADVVQAARLIKDMDIKLGIQVMPGLPGDTLASALETTQDVIALRPHMVRIYPAITLKGTRMEQLCLEGAYRPLTLEEAVEWCTRIVPLYREAGIGIGKMGLHYSELLEGAVVSGPYHPAFGELVEARMLLIKMIQCIEEQNLTQTTDIRILTGKGGVSAVTGHQKANLNALRSRYPYRKIRVEEDETLSRGEIRITPLGPIKETES